MKKKHQHQKRRQSDLKYLWNEYPSIILWRGTLTNKMCISNESCMFMFHTYVYYMSMQICCKLYTHSEEWSITAIEASSADICVIVRYKEHLNFKRGWKIQSAYLSIRIKPIRLLLLLCPCLINSQSMFERFVLRLFFFFLFLFSIWRETIQTQYTGGFVLF